jgi:uncharacterized repeat protein (TIGR03803 family)
VDHRSHSARFLVGIALPAALAAAPVRAEYHEEVLHSFTQNTGIQPVDGMVVGPNGILYGSAGGGAPAYEGPEGVVYQLQAPAVGKAHWTYSKIFIAGPAGVPVLNTTPTLAGLYLTFPTGDGYGSIYQLVPSVGYKEIFTEAGGNASNLNPVSLGVDGVLYGTFQRGGFCIVNGIGYHSCPLFYSLTPPESEGGNWMYTTLYQFPPDGTSGSVPPGRLVADGAALYGVAAYQSGEVVRMNPPNHNHSAWTETVIYRHDGDANHDTVLNPILNLGPDGALSLTASTATAGQYGQVLRLTPPAKGESWDKTVVYGKAGFVPNSGVAFDAAGAIYGSENSAAGPVYRLKPYIAAGGGTRWSLKALYSFKGAPDGSHPNPDLIIGNDGNLYGATNLGGDHDEGIIYRIDLK